MAIIMVVIAHSYCLLQRLNNSHVLIKYINLFERYIINLGPIGVELFFVLSGFLIGGILIKIFDTSDFTFAEVRRFWIRRWFRTLPNYWLILSINIIIFVFIKGNTIDTNQFLGYVFLQNFIHPDVLHVFPEGWSLSVEEWFYLTLPLVMYLFHLIVKPVNKPGFLFKVFIAYLTLFLLIRIFNAFNPVNGNDPDEGIRKIVIFRLDAVMYGVLAAYGHYYHKPFINTVKKKLFIIGAVGSLLLYYFIIRYELAFRYQPNATFRFSVNAFFYMIIPFVFALSLPYAAGTRQWSNKYISAIVRHISKISYSMYLVHFSLFVPLFLNRKADSAYIGIAQYLIYWIVVIVSSSLLYRYFEYPVMQLREKWHGEK